MRARLIWLYNGHTERMTSMLRPELLAALRANPAGATAYEVRVLADAVFYLTEEMAYWDTRSKAYERTLIDLTEAMMLIRRSLTRCQRVSSCGHLEDARAAAVESLAWKDAQDA